MKKDSTFIALAVVLEQVRGTTSKKEKVRLLAGYLKGVPTREVATAARIAVGRTSPRGSKDEAQVGYSTILEVLKEITGATSASVSKAYLRHGDLGEVAQELLETKTARTLFDEPITLSGLEDAFEKLRSSKGGGSVQARKGVLTSLFLSAAPLEGKYLVKVLTSEMRTGLVSGLLEEAVSLAYGVSKDDAARAHMVLGDPGDFAEAAAEGRLGKVRMEAFRPVNFMLAEPVPDAAEAARHFSKEALAEFKYDGVRAQVHKKGGEVRVYSRRLEDITASFPEVVAALSSAPGDFIVDGEVVPFSEGRPLPFQLLQRRLRRQEDFEEAQKNAPVVLFAFDVLMRDGRETTGLPLDERKRTLRAIIGGSAAREAESQTVSTAKDVEAAFRRSRSLGYEGLVIKDPASPYVMGKRGSGWVKLKEELDTLDVVIVGAEYGHGKRAGVISDYTFAVRDGTRLATIGKAYSGLTDEEIDSMTEKLKEITIKDHGYSRDVRPEVVLEVAFDSIQKSSRHNSGYALRFPRIKRIRTDKSPSDIDDLAAVEKIFSGQKLKLEK